jgi:CheY-like chemotaxis protein
VKPRWKSVTRSRQAERADHEDVLAVQHPDDHRLAGLLAAAPDAMACAAERERLPTEAERDKLERQLNQPQLNQPQLNQRQLNQPQRLESLGQLADPQRGQGETVLLVEDEAAMREVTRRILARNGYHVVTADSGHEALNLLAGQLERIDVLLTDVVMPHMQGRELADKIRILKPTVRVAFMSGYTQGLLSAQGVLEPGVHLIEKPFSEAILLTKLREILSTHS